MSYNYCGVGIQLYSFSFYKDKLLFHNKLGFNHIFFFFELLFKYDTKADNRFHSYSSFLGT